MTDIITAITSVFDAVSTWIQTALNNMIPIFWTAGSGSTPGQLTLIGVLTVVALGFSVVFLVLGLLQRWFKFGA